MVYLDYAANTPVDKRVMDVFEKITMQYYGNPNGHYSLGRNADKIITEASEKIKALLNIPDMEVIYTSGATEANNLAIKGIARTYRENGRHIISTGLEHSSVSGVLTYLQTLGYEIDLLDINEAGQVDLEHLKELLRNDTILVSVCFVDSELGTVQPISEIAEIVKAHTNCYFHVDATQAVGKIPVTCDNIDLLTFAPHKFYGLNGTGVLLKREDIILEPIIHGGNSTSIYRSGTPVPAFCAAVGEALLISLQEMAERLVIIQSLKDKLIEKLSEYPLVRINSTDKSIPHFLNISIKGIKASAVQEQLDAMDIYISPKSACSTPNTPSRAVYAVTKDRKNAIYSWRISLSHLVTDSEIDEFLQAFDRCCKRLT